MSVSSSLFVKGSPFDTALFVPCISDERRANDGYPQSGCFRVLVVIRTPRLSQYRPGGSGSVILTIRGRQRKLYVPINIRTTWPAPSDLPTL